MYISIFVKHCVYSIICLPLPEKKCSIDLLWFIATSIALNEGPGFIQRFKLASDFYKNGMSLKANY